MNTRKFARAAFAVLGVGLITLGLGVVASDHDDGEMDLKGRSLNLTDLYVFREDWQDSAGSSQNLIFIMNSNPRSLARQQYYFSTQARYEFHLTRVAGADKSVRPTGREDVVLRFEFGSPNASGNQAITMTAIRDGQAISQSAGLTTTLADMNGNTIRNNSLSLGGQNLTVFAGLREDPFYFDVERYFRIRGLLATGVNTLGSGPTQGSVTASTADDANVFRSTPTAVDFAAGYNVNSIVVKVPISFLQSGAGEPVFDVWETISVRQ
jgi:hypothetical protein